MVSSAGSPNTTTGELARLIALWAPLDVHGKADLLELLEFAGKGEQARLMMTVYLHLVSELVGLEEKDRALPVRDRKRIHLTKLMLAICSATLSLKDREQLWVEFGLDLDRESQKKMQSLTDYLTKRLTAILRRLPDPQPAIAQIRKILAQVRSAHLKEKELHRITTELLSLSEHSPTAQLHVHQSDGAI